VASVCHRLWFCMNKIIILAFEVPATCRGSVCSWQLRSAHTVRKLHVGSQSPTSVYAIMSDAFCHAQVGTQVAI
jgi:hypothetical protein